MNTLNEKVMKDFDFSDEAIQLFCNREDDFRYLKKSVKSAVDKVDSMENFVLGDNRSKNLFNAYQVLMLLFNKVLNDDDNYDVSIESLKKDLLVHLDFYCIQLYFEYLVKEIKRLINYDVVDDDIYNLDEAGIIKKIDELIDKFGREDVLSVLMTFDINFKKKEESDWNKGTEDYTGALDSNADVYLQWYFYDKIKKEKVGYNDPRFDSIREEVMKAYPILADRFVVNDRYDFIIDSSQLDKKFSASFILYKKIYNHVLEGSSDEQKANAERKYQLRNASSHGEYVFFDGGFVKVSNNDEFINIFSLDDLLVFVNNAFDKMKNFDDYIVGGEFLSSLKLLFDYLNSDTSLSNYDCYEFADLLLKISLFLGAQYSEKFYNVSKQNLKSESFKKLLFEVPESSNTDFFGVSDVDGIGYVEINGKKVKFDNLDGNVMKGNPRYKPLYYINSDGNEKYSQIDFMRTLSNAVGHFNVKQYFGCIICPNDYYNYMCKDEMRKLSKNSVFNNGSDFRNLKNSMRVMFRGCDWINFLSNELIPSLVLDDDYVEYKNENVDVKVA